MDGTAGMITAGETAGVTAVVTEGVTADDGVCNGWRNVGCSGVGNVICDVVCNVVCNVVYNGMCNGSVRSIASLAAARPMTNIFYVTLPTGTTVT